jgi:hypothetical protein
MAVYRLKGYTFQFLTQIIFTTAGAKYLWMLFLDGFFKDSYILQKQPYATG